MSRLFLLLSFMYAFGVFSYIAISNQQQVKAATNHIVISQIQIAGAGNASDEFVELYNPTDASIDISGWRLSRKTATAGVTPQNLVASLSGMIAARSYYLIAHPASSYTLFADRLYSSSSSALTTNNTILLYSDAGQSIVDKVGIGTAADFESAAVPTNPGNNQSILRKASENSTENSLITGGNEIQFGNGFDTDNNSFDFVNISSAMPRNSKSPQALPFITSTPTPSDTPIPTNIPTQAPSPVPTIVPTATAIPTPTNTPVPTPTPTPLPTSTPTPTPSPTATPTPKLTSTPMPTNTPTPLPTATPLPTQTPTPLPTNTPVPTSTPIPTLLPTVIPTATTIPTPTSPAPTRMPQPTIMPTAVPTPSPAPNNQVIYSRKITSNLSLVCIESFKKITIFKLVFSIPSIHCSIVKH